MLLINTIIDNHWYFPSRELHRPPYDILKFTVSHFTHVPKANALTLVASNGLAALFVGVRCRWVIDSSCR